MDDIAKWVKSVNKTIPARNYSGRNCFTVEVGK